MTPHAVRDTVRPMSRPSTALVQGIPLFAELDESTIDRLAADFVERRFDTGATIATEGTGGLNFFVIESGEAAVTVQGRTVGTLGPGASFGEVALVDKEARSATVTASSPIVAWALPVWSFRSFVETRPEVSWRLLELMAERLRAAETRR